MRHEIIVNWHECRNAKIPSKPRANVSSDACDKSAEVAQLASHSCSMQQKWTPHSAKQKLPTSACTRGKILRAV